VYSCPPEVIAAECFHPADTFVKRPMPPGRSGYRETLSVLFTTARELVSGRRLVSSNNHLLIAPVHICTKFVHMIELAPVHVFTIFTTANQKAPSKTVVHKIQCS